jgi:glycerol-3-phosphate dehydrogenase
VSAIAADNYDVLVIGGGVNGSGIARDAAGADGYSCANRMIWPPTSSASTKLIHGGLRYLEFHFALVRKALREREVLLSAARTPRPLHFVMPHDAHLRPAWMIAPGCFSTTTSPRAGLAASSAVDLKTHIAGEPLKKATDVAVYLMASR